MKRNIISILVPKFSTKSYGGNTYESAIIKSLKEQYEINIIPLYEKSSKLKTLTLILLGIFHLKFNRSNILLLNQSTVFLYSLFSSKEILLIHHVDWSQSRWTSAFLQRISFKVMLLNKNKWKKIIVVSEYWKVFLEKKGFRNIQIIYNTINPNIKSLPLLSKWEFFEKYNLYNENLIYLGNAQKGKGWKDVYEQIKSRDFIFIISGQHDGEIYDLPSKVRYLDLPYEDYLAMLKYVKISILFSRFEEGWNRTAHESILMGTPVIGSRSGGMTELLEKSGQLICENIRDVERNIEIVLQRREQLATSGYAYLKQFDEVYFKNAWIKVIQSIE